MFSGVASSAVVNPAAFLVSSSSVNTRAQIQTTAAHYSIHLVCTWLPSPVSIQHANTTQTNDVRLRKIQYIHTTTPKR